MSHCLSIRGFFPTIPPFSLQTLLSSLGHLLRLELLKSKDMKGRKVVLAIFSSESELELAKKKITNLQYGEEEISAEIVDLRALQGIMREEVKIFEKARKKLGSERSDSLHEEESNFRKKRVSLEKTNSRKKKEGHRRRSGGEKEGRNKWKERERESEETRTNSNFSNRRLGSERHVHARRWDVEDMGNKEQEQPKKNFFQRRMGDEEVGINSGDSRSYNPFEKKERRLWSEKEPEVSHLRTNKSFKDDNKVMEKKEELRKKEEEFKEGRILKRIGTEEDRIKGTKVFKLKENGENEKLQLCTKKNLGKIIGRNVGEEGAELFYDAWHRQGYFGGEFGKGILQRNQVNFYNFQYNAPFYNVTSNETLEQIKNSYMDKKEDESKIYINETRNTGFSQEKASTQLEVIKFSTLQKERNSQNFQNLQNSLFFQGNQSYEAGRIDRSDSPLKNTDLQSPKQNANVQNRSASSLIEDNEDYSIKKKKKISEEKRTSFKGRNTLFKRQSPKKKSRHSSNKSKERKRPEKRRGNEKKSSKEKRIREFNFSKSSKFERCLEELERKTGINKNDLKIPFNVSRSELRDIYHKLLHKFIWKLHDDHVSIQNKQERFANYRHREHNLRMKHMRHEKNKRKSKFSEKIETKNAKNTLECEEFGFKLSQNELKDEEVLYQNIQNNLENQPNDLAQMKACLTSNENPFKTEKEENNLNSSQNLNPSMEIERNLEHSHKKSLTEAHSSPSEENIGKNISTTTENEFKIEEKLEERILAKFDEQQPEKPVKSELTEKLEDQKTKEMQEKYVKKEMAENREYIEKPIQLDAYKGSIQKIEYNIERKDKLEEEKDKNEVVVTNKTEEKLKEDKPEDKKGKLLEHIFKELGPTQDKKKIKDYLNFLIKGGDLNNLKENLKKKLKQE